MIPQLTLKEFEEKYAFNDHRKHLFDLFVDDMEMIKSQSRFLRVLVFGSYITTKKEPHDIDVLITLIPENDAVYTIMTEGLQQKHPDEIDVQYKKAQLFMKKPEGLLRFFNENPFNRKRGVRIKHAVQIMDV